MSNFLLKYKIYLLAALVIIWFIYGTTTNNHEPKIDLQQKPISVKVQTSNSISKDIIYKAYGNISAASSSLISYQHNNGQGIVTEIMVKTGDKVYLNQPLLKIRRNDHNQLIQKYHVNYKKALKEGDIDHINQAKISLDHAQNYASETTIISPLNGYVDQVFVDVGGYVPQNNSGDLLRVINLDYLDAEIDIPEYYIDKVKINEIINVIFNNQSAKATIYKISPKGDQSTRTFTIKAKIDNKAKNYRFSNISCSANVIIGQTKAHFVPLSALVFNANGEKGIMTSDESGIAKFNSVKIIDSDSNGIWVDNLPEKINYISLGNNLVKNGSKIEIAE